MISSLFAFLTDLVIIDLVKNNKKNLFINLYFLIFKYLTFYDVYVLTFDLIQIEMNLI